MSQSLTCTAAAAAPVLSLSGVSAMLAGRLVLHDVSLGVAPGELVALQGPSGAGKTTLLRVAAGLVPAQGMISAGGGGRPALIFQHHALATRLSVRDNVLIGALSRIGLVRTTLRRWPVQELEQAAACLERVGLAGLGDRRADTLSGGQRQRVAIARALAQNAAVLLADEPVASLDPENADLIMALLHDLARKQNLAVLVSLHQPKLASRFADRSLRMVDGRIIGETDFAAQRCL